MSAVVLAWWLGRVAGPWTGVLAGALLALLPMAVLPQDTSFGRSAYLDPVAEAFMVCSVALAWVWFRATGRRGWLFAIATGAVTGLAAASKENGFLGALGVVLLGCFLACRAERAVRVYQALAAVGAALVVFICCYLPLGDPVSRISYLIRFQWSEHGRIQPICFAAWPTG
jgi:4-amino-4-deoxy-L-arabinose transferase-like glycosyltransferase